MAKRAAAKSRNYWLFKSEPSAFSIDDLAAEKTKTTFWDGVRNYQARNMLRDEVKLGDRVFLYHSNADPMAIVGLCEVVREGYPDHTAFDPANKHYDEKSNPENPTWFMVDIKLVAKFDEPVTRDQLKDEPQLADMMLLRRGSRLSIQPVTLNEYQTVLKMAGLKANI
ncbi:MAG: EVE domain-containing protein [Planctomycetaceae bacterium]|nr:EVE domain-containing protein [Planctomycetaceae bacterium]MCA9043165.1 EVE domain-containing protein [Planctomycetaceae bacterium]MCB9950280.1 EVE domain-containing protein [Planctomycetaceae bacterium]